MHSNRFYRHLELENFLGGGPPPPPITRAFDINVLWPYHLSKADDGPKMMWIVTSMTKSHDVVDHVDICGDDCVVSLDVYDDDFDDGVNGDVDDEGDNEVSDMVDDSLEKWILT